MGEAARSPIGEWDVILFVNGGSVTAGRSAIGTLTMLVVNGDRASSGSRRCIAGRFEGAVPGRRCGIPMIPPPLGNAEAMNLSALVFDIGDQVTGWGQIRYDDDGVWFDPAHPITFAGRPRGWAWVLGNGAWPPAQPATGGHVSTWCLGIPRQTCGSAK